ncbi:hypothetical protein EKPJFOCH_4447 [Methylobacterium thuringiense]|uniref:Uncharacterized protein n=1 Tax=Methylobacterium thuringiense TaxID=1003091 RepID=A0ABQ4TU10_9HYPH|nr:hypothetical protein EKPJFOCH_4447 [Methylobacterium thuringiense]
MSGDARSAFAIGRRLAEAKLAAACIGPRFVACFSAGPDRAPL